MQTFNRTCIEDFKLVEGDLSVELRKGKEYLTSAEVSDGEVVVFTRCWASVPVSIFKDAKEFTPETWNP